MFGACPVRVVDDPVGYSGVTAPVEVLFAVIEQFRYAGKLETFHVIVSTTPVVGVAVPVDICTVPLIESQKCDEAHAGVPGLVPAPGPAAKVGVP